MPYRCYCVGYRGEREEDVFCTLDAGEGRGGESAAAAAAALEFSRCYSSGSTVHTRHSRRRLGLGNPGSLQEAGNNSCFCLIITDTGFSFYRDD